MPSRLCYLKTVAPLWGVPGLLALDNTVDLGVKRKPRKAFQPMLPTRPDRQEVGGDMVAARPPSPSGSTRI
jgi:hypothetical protein